MPVQVILAGVSVYAWAQRFPKSRWQSQWLLQPTELLTTNCTNPGIAVSPKQQADYPPLPWVCASNTEMPRLQQWASTEGSRRKWIEVFPSSKDFSFSANRR